MRYLLCFFLMAASSRAAAQIYVTDTNAYYVQDFDGLDSFGTGAVAMPAGWHFYEWGSAADNTYRAGTGSSATSDTYSFGPLRSRDRALGSLASGTLTRIVYGTMFINRSGSDINAVSVACRGEQWRRGGSGAPDSLRCFFTTVRGTRLDDTGFAAWTEIPELLFQSVSTLKSAAALNGNDSCRILHADIPLMLHHNDTLLIRWRDLNAPGNDDGLAVDSFSIRFRNGAVTQSNHPRLLSFAPDSNAPGLAPDLSLELKFDRAVRAGSGSLYIRDLGTSRVDTIPASAGQGRNGGRDLVFGGLPLLRGCEYMVRFDSSAFDSLGYRSCGLYDSSWIFRVAALEIPPRSQPGDPGLHALGDGRILLRPGSAFPGTCLLRIYGMDGRLLYERRLRVGAGDTILDPGLPAGSCYGVLLGSEGRVLRARLCRP